MRFASERKTRLKRSNFNYMIPNACPAKIQVEIRIRAGDAHETVLLDSWPNVQTTENRVSLTFNLFRELTSLRDFAANRDQANRALARTQELLRNATN